MAKLAPETVVKTPAEAKLVNFEFVADLDTGRVLTGTPVFTITPAGPTQSNQTVLGSKAQLMISAGTAGNYTVDAKVTDDGIPQQTYEGRGNLVIQALS